jgi:hypothetical protein
MKSIEIIKQKIYRELVNDGLASNSDNEEWINGIVQKAIDATQRWIPVEEELPENIKELIGNNIQSENVLVKRKWDDTGEIAIEINRRFRPGPRIGFLWNVEYKGSEIIEWRPIEIN